MDLGLLLEYIFKSLFLLVFCTGGFAYVTYYERKVLARIQVRIGPNRAGPWGIFQPVADGVKLIFKEELIPAKADKILFILAPVITVIPALVIMGVLPWGTEFTAFGRVIKLHLADINVGVLYITAIASIAVYGIVLAGWSSNNKYAMMGGLRASAQMISYELAMALTFIGPILLTGSMRLSDIVEKQAELGLQGIFFSIIWLVAQPLGAIIFLISGVAETNRAPFDMPEAEQELVAGYHAEYSGMKFALFFMAEYIKMIAIAAISATMFFGGYLGPFVDRYPLLGPVYMFIKIFVLLFLMIWIRATLPRFRYDRLMEFGWKILLPLALLNVLITAVLVVFLGG